jgi:hypothetical protein
MPLDLFKNKGQEEAMYLIENCNGVLLGSRAFEVNDDYSDWDVAILAADLPDKYKNSTQFDITRYFIVLPLGNSFLIKEPHLDILVFEKQDDLNAVRETVNDLKDIPSYLLKNKQSRIYLFEESLKHYGFKEGVPF